MIERVEANIHMGLNREQVQERIRQKLVHKNTMVTTKSVKEILLSNILTLFNLVNLILGCFIVFTGSYKNLLFLGVAFCNTIISMVQEIHAKHIIDKLAIVSSSKVLLVRNGKEEYHSIDDIVLDDVIMYAVGNQVVVDSIIEEGSVEVDESFITGEADSVVKEKGEMLLSGSFILSGSCYAKVEHIGDENYTNKISKEAKYIKEVNSEIMKTMKKIIKVISIVIFPLGFLLFMQQLHLDGNTLSDSIINTVAALIGMIPEGLVLLTSTVLAVGSIRLARKRVLVQELYCIETLARVDTVCLDKTGTITEGKMEIIDMIELKEEEPLLDIFRALSFYNQDKNATSLAIREKFKGRTDYKMIDFLPFSSKRKYSAMTFEKYGTYVLGAPELLTQDGKVLEKVAQYSSNRVVMLARTSSFCKDPIEQTEPLALLIIQDKIRKSARKTLEYFKEEGVDIKLISGDSVETVSQIAERVGLKDLKGFDMSTLTKEDNLKEIVENYQIFGRVTPSGKKDLILALKAKGHTVAMTGDGVNDVLALKESDCSLAMATGSDAARSVSELVLLDSNFDALPKIVNEGRRSINNLERSATLFLTKTIYSTLLAILFIFIQRSYPFQPIQLSLNSIVTIGIPSFILALEPNHNRIQGTFIINVIRKSIPAALTLIVNILSVMLFTSMFRFSDDYASTMSSILLAFTGFLLLFKICIPFNYLRGILFGTLVGIFVGGAIGLNKLFDFVLLTPMMFLFVALLCLVDIPIFQMLTVLCEKKIFKYQERIVK